MHHCAGGTGPSDFGQNGIPAPDSDPSTSLAAALEAWVEAGRAPEQLVAREQTQPDAAEGQPVRTGLICAYPKHAMLRPGADPVHAESYSCVDPQGR
jgi:feruloyl esterase